MDHIVPQVQEVLRSTGKDLDGLEEAFLAWGEGLQVRWSCETVVIFEPAPEAGSNVSRSKCCEHSTH